MSLIISDSFHRANTSLGTIGVPDTHNSPSTGGAWIDVTGLTGQIQSNMLLLTVPGVTAPLNIVRRPSTEDVRDEQLVVTTSSLGLTGDIFLLVRLSPDNSLGYILGTANGNVYIFTLIDNNLGSVVSGPIPDTLLNTHIYKLIASAIGASPTSLELQIYDLGVSGSENTLVFQTSAVESTSSLQVPGGMGVVIGGDTGDTLQISQIQTYQGSMYDDTTLVGPLQVLGLDGNLYPIQQYTVGDQFPDIQVNLNTGSSLSNQTLQAILADSNTTVTFLMMNRAGTSTELDSSMVIVNPDLMTVLYKWGNTDLINEDYYEGAIQVAPGVGGGVFTFRAIQIEVSSVGELS